MTADVRSAALDYAATYALKPYDAAHLATAIQAGVFDIASFDEAFRKVDGLHLWNDRIHAR